MFFQIISKMHHIEGNGSPQLDRIRYYYKYEITRTGQKYWDQPQSRCTNEANNFNMTSCIAEYIATVMGCSMNFQGIVPEKAQVNCADRHVNDREIIKIGNVTIKAIASPGHTDCHFAYLVNDTHLLTGDALFIRGCGRTDFQHGDAGNLYDSITQKFFTLPDDTLVYPCHDYRGQTVSTIGEEKRFNPRLAGKDRKTFQEIMDNLNLPNPQKMMEPVPANQQCGKVAVSV